MRDLVSIGRFRISLWWGPSNWRWQRNTLTYVWSLSFWRLEVCFLTRKYAGGAK